MQGQDESACRPRPRRGVDQIVVPRKHLGVLEWISVSSALTSGTKIGGMISPRGCFVADVLSADTS